MKFFFLPAILVALFITLSSLCAQQQILVALDTLPGSNSYTDCTVVSGGGVSGFNKSSSGSNGPADPNNAAVVFKGVYFQGIHREGEVTPNELDNIVNVQQYAAFLNAVAAKADPHNLYDAVFMENVITRSENNDGSFVYTIVSGQEQLPMSGVTINNALRYCNWLANERPSSDDVIESFTEHGVYDLAENPQPMPETGHFCIDSILFSDCDFSEAYGAGGDVSNWVDSTMFQSYNGPTLVPTPPASNNQPTPLQPDKSSNGSDDTADIKIAIGVATEAIRVVAEVIVVGVAIEIILAGVPVAFEILKGVAILFNLLW